MNMRNATCVGTKTSKVPTSVTFLFIFYSVPTSGVAARVVGGSGGMLPRENFEMYSLANAISRVFGMKLFPFCG